MQGRRVDRFIVRAGTAATILFIARIVVGHCRPGLRELLVQWSLTRAAFTGLSSAGMVVVTYHPRRAIQGEGVQGT